MQEHKYINKLEILKENSAKLFLICPEEEKTAKKIHDLAEKLMSKLFGKDVYVKVKIEDTLSLVKKRGFSNITEATKENFLPKVVAETIEVLDDEFSGVKNTKTIFKNNGLKVDIDKTTLKNITPLINKISQMI